MGDDTDDLVTLMLLAAADSSDEQLAKALHKIANSSPEVIREFNRFVDLDERRRVMRPVPLTRLMTKNEFGAN